MTLYFFFFLMVLLKKQSNSSEYTSLMGFGWYIRMIPKKISDLTCLMGFNVGVFTN